MILNTTHLIMCFVILLRVLRSHITAINPFAKILIRLCLVDRISNKNRTRLDKINNPDICSYHIQVHPIPMWDNISNDMLNPIKIILYKVNVKC